MPIIDPVFEITPNAADAIRRSSDPAGTLGSLIVELGNALITGQSIDITVVTDFVLSIDRAFGDLVGLDQVLNRVLENTPGAWSMNGSDINITSPGVAQAINGFTNVTGPVNPTGSGTRYDVNGGQNDFTELDQVPWDSLQPGDCVNIYWRSTPYRNTFMLTEQGTATDRIVINGVTNASGQRPIITGENATVVDSFSFIEGLQNNIILFGRKHQSAGGVYGVNCTYTDVQNLQLSNIRSTYNFTYRGVTTNWPLGSRCVRVYGGEHIRMFGCIFEDADAGYFAYCPDDGALSRDLLVSGCRFFNTGDGTRDHQIYIQAIADPALGEANIIEGCVFDYPTPGQSIAQLKTRSMSNIIRYNYFSPAARVIDIVESEDAIPPWMYANLTSQEILDSYHTSYIYGNIFAMDADVQGGSLFGYPVHIGADNATEPDLVFSAGGDGPALGFPVMRGAHAPSYFFHNTYYHKVDTPQVYRAGLFDLDNNNSSPATSDPGTIELWNNILEVAGTSRRGHQRRSGTSNFNGVNLLYTDTATIWGESDLFINQNNTGDDPLVDINFNGTVIENQSALFTDPNNPVQTQKDFSLQAGSPAIGQAVPLPAVLSGHPVLLQPGDPAHGGAVVRPNTVDLGALESGISTLHDSFNGTGGLDPAKWDTFQPSAVSIIQSGGRYVASIPAGNADGTTWFNGSEGRLDYQTFTGDFEVIARNIGIEGSINPNDFQFCGLCVRASAGNYEFNVVGERGTDGSNTLEYKSTVGFSSTQNDLVDNTAVNHKLDLRVTRQGSTVRFWYQDPTNTTDNWLETPMSNLSQRTSFGTGAVQVGILTYGFAFVDAFQGVCDQYEIVSGNFS